jgi:hypothetical protein
MYHGGLDGTPSPQSIPANLPATYLFQWSTSGIPLKSPSLTVSTFLHLSIGHRAHTESVFLISYGCEVLAHRGWHLYVRSCGSHFLSTA